MFFAVVFAAAAVSNGIVDVFFQRISDNGFPPQPTPTITVGALPPNWTPPVPLPQNITIVGSVLKPKFSTEIYYEPSDASGVAKAYVEQLRAAGFTPHQAFPGQRGFVFGELRPTLMTLCRGTEGVSISTPAADDLRVIILAPNGRNVCGPSPMRISTPVPQLVLPAGVTIVSGGGGSAIYSSSGESSTFSEAVLQTALSLKRVLAAFDAQMLDARWKPQRAFVTAQSAAQSFTYNDGPLQWKATILVFPGEKPHMYDARFAASGTPEAPMQPRPVIAPQRPAQHLRPSDEPALLQLAQRIADGVESETPPSINLRRVPSGFDSRIPTPDSGLVGSVAYADSTSLYYDVTQSQFDAYLARLRVQGWSAMPQAFPQAAGFALRGLAGVSSFCKPGFPLVNTAVTANTNELTIHVASNAMRACTIANVIPGAAAMAQAGPAPELHAPADASMKPPAPIIPGMSHATIVSARGVSDLLAGFASQLIAQKWSAGAPLTNGGFASQTFSYTDEHGIQWKAILTLLRSTANATTYDAFLNLARQ
jgi:hypothetical protein